MCVLKLFSAEKSFRAFASKCSMPVYSVKEAGETRRKSTGEVREEHRISFDVSDREWDEFPAQAKEAEAFLEKYRSELTELFSTHPISSAYLDFPIWSRLSEEIVNQNDHLPAGLVATCGSLGLGIEMSQYSRDAFDGLDEPGDSEE